MVRFMLAVKASVNADCTYAALPMPGCDGALRGGYLREPSAQAYITYIYIHMYIDEVHIVLYSDARRLPITALCIVKLIGSHPCKAELVC